MYIHLRARFSVIDPELKETEAFLWAYFNKTDPVLSYKNYCLVIIYTIEQSPEYLSDEYLKSMEYYIGLSLCLTVW